MPLTPDPPSVLADALPRLAGPADPAERARLLAAAAQAVTGLGAAVVILAEDGAVEAVAGSDAGCREVADAGAGTVGAARAKGALSGADWERIAADRGWGPPCVVPMADDTAGPRRGRLGALVLLPAAGAGVPAAQAARARTLAAVTVAALLQQRALVRERATARQLATALESRVVIEQAK